MIQVPSILVAALLDMGRIGSSLVLSFVQQILVEEAEAAHLKVLALLDMPDFIIN
jgi:hypothetical protein